jgi:hypothetical protein
MDRFISGAYSKQETKAAMIGYVQGATCDEVLVAVNVAVQVHPRMGVGHRLYSVNPLPFIPNKYESRHNRTPHPRINISHYWVDLPAAASGRE